MALTTAQKLSCYEILGVTAGPGGGTEEDTLTLHNGYGITLTLSEMDNLRDKVEAALTGLASGQETKVAAIVTEWDAMGFNVGTLDGSVGNVQGVSFSWKEKREYLYQRLTYFVPIEDMARGIKKRNEKTNGNGYIGFNR